MGRNRRCSAAPAGIPVQLLVVCTAERGLCGAFQFLDRTPGARTRRWTCKPQGKTVKLPLHRSEGLRSFEAPIRFADHRSDRIARRVKQLGFGNADEIGRKIIDLFEKGEFAVATLFFSRFRSVIQQIPTALQIIPAELPEGAGVHTHVHYETEPEPDELLSVLLPRNISIQVFRALLENAASEQGAANERDGQRHAQCRRNDQEADIEI